MYATYTETGLSGEGTGVIWHDGKKARATPHCVLEVTGEYHNEMDVLRGFLDAMCELRSHKSEKMAMIYAEYKEWYVQRKRRGRKANGHSSLY